MLCQDQDEVQGCALIWLVILAILLPPLAISFRLGCVKEVCFALILMLLFWIPSIIYALYIIFTEQKPNAGEEGHTTAGDVHAAAPSAARAAAAAPQQQPVIHQTA